MDEKAIQAAISKRYLGRLLTQTVGWCVFVSLAAFVSFVLCTQVVWQPYETLYIILSAVRDMLPVVLLVLFLLGFIVIMLLQWRRVAKSFMALTATVQLLSRQDDTPIALPGDLREIEDILRGVQAENRRARLALAEAERRRKDIVLSLAHDLKTPLTSVMGYLTLLQDEPDMPAERRRHCVDVAADKAHRLEALTGEFFEITRLGLNDYALDVAPLDLTLMLEQMASEFEPLLAPKRLRMEVRLAAGLRCEADAGKLERVFDNLLRNAVSYCTEASTLHLDAVREGAEICIRLDNEGEDIPPERLSRLFDMFYRADPSRGTAEGGAGLGLAIARELVELHGGSIGAESSGGHVCFTVRLPALGSAARATPRLPAAGAGV